MDDSPIPRITLTEAARILNVSRKTVERWVASKKLKTVKVGSRYRTTIEWINEQVTSTTAPEPEPNGKLVAKPKGVSRDSSFEEETRRSHEMLKAMFGIGRNKVFHPK